MPVIVLMECDAEDQEKVDRLHTHPPHKYLHDLDEIDYRERTVLHLAVEHGHDDVVDVLTCRYSTDLSAKDCGGFNALHLAAELGHDKMVARLLEKNPDLIDEPAYGNLTCLHLATIKGHASIVKQLLTMKLGIIDAEDARGRSALDFAVKHDHKDIIAILVESSKSLRGDFKEMLFHKAIRAEHDHIAAQILAQNPGLIDTVDREGRSALHLAAVHRCHAVVDQLFALKPNWTEVGGDYKMTLLHFAAEFGYDTIAAKLLVEKPHLIDVTGDGGRSVLHLAAARGHGNVVSQLLAAKPDLDRKIDWDGETALHHAARCGRKKVVDQLLTYNPELINVEDDVGMTALHAAVHNRDWRSSKTVACLLAHGATGLEEHMLWTMLNRTNGSSTNAAVTLMLDRRPEMIWGVDELGRTVLHCVFGRQQGFGPACPVVLFSEELMLKCWQMNPGAVHEADLNDETPFHVAIRRNNKFAMELVQSKLALDEIVSAFATCEEPVPQSLLNNIHECLMEPLSNKDVIGVVGEYIGFVPKQSNKRRRDDDSRSESNEESNEEGG